MLFCGDSVIYVGHLTKKKGLFQKPYEIKGRDIYITDTKRAKTKLLKSSIRNIVFGEEFARDGIIGDKIAPCSGYDRNFVVGYLPHMIMSVADFMHLTLPVEEIVVFSQSGDVCSISRNFAKLVSVVGQGEDKITDGVQIRYIKKVRTAPGMVITESGGGVSPVLRVPCINIGVSRCSSPFELSWQSSTFKTDAFPFDIGMSALMFFMQKGEKLAYEPTSFRKKAPPIYTFC